MTVPAGRTWTVTAEPVERPGTAREQVAAGADPIDLRLPRTAVLRGRCLDAEGRPIAGAEVVASDAPTSGGSGRSVLETDRDGWVEVPGLDAERDEVCVKLHTHRDDECLPSVEHRGRVPAAEPFILRVPVESAGR